jgi:hypothetical protein
MMQNRVKPSDWKLGDKPIYTFTYYRRKLWGWIIALVAIWFAVLIVNGFLVCQVGDVCGNGIGLIQKLQLTLGWLATR